MKTKLLFAIFTAIALSGCIQPAQPQPAENCEQFCQSQPHMQCLGNWSISGTFPDCNCSFECEAVPVKECAEEGEQFSAVYPSDYPEKCCLGLTEWASGMDSHVSIADQCYETGLLKGSPVGTCIDCGNGECEGNEQPCNCPQDCIGKGKSDYNSTGEFCVSPFMSQACLEGAPELPLCGLCTQQQEPALPEQPAKQLNCAHYVYSNCPEGCVKKFVPDSMQCPLGESVICNVDFDVAGSCVELPE